MCAEEHQGRPRGLDIDVEDPLVKGASIAGAAVSLVLLVVLFPDHEQSLFCCADARGHRGIYLQG